MFRSLSALIGVGRIKLARGAGQGSVSRGPLDTAGCEQRKRSITLIRKSRKSAGSWNLVSRLGVD